MENGTWGLGNWSALHNWQLRFSEARVIFPATPCAFIQLLQMGHSEHVSLFVVGNLATWQPAKDETVLEIDTCAALFATQSPHRKEQQVASADGR